jgi:ABC-type multidrug transport system permease subunit
MHHIDTLMLLSAVFFYLFSMPAYLRYVTYVLPLTCVTEGWSVVMIRSNYPWETTEITVVAIIRIIVFAVAAKLLN